MLSAPSSAPVRRIIHIDMDAFYASVEQRDNPALRGRPLAVGGDHARGVVAAASYEARRFGVRSAMASRLARHRCPELLFVAPRFAVYRQVSGEIHAILTRFTPIVEPVSLDEAYLDVTEAIAGFGSATAIAAEIRRLIRTQTGLTASAGVSYNKLLAKLASDHRKPDGLFVITPKMGADFVGGLPVEAFHGIGPATAARMRALGIATGRDLRAQPRAALIHHFGKAGEFYHQIARGQDPRAVEPDRVRKSLGAETTFAEDLWQAAAIEAGLRPLIARVWTLSRSERFAGRTVTLKIRYADFTQATRSRSTAAAVGSEAALRTTALDLLSSLQPWRRGVRLLGVAVARLEARQGVLLLHADADADAHGRR